MVMYRNDSTGKVHDDGKCKEQVVGILNITYAELKEHLAEAKSAEEQLCIKDEMGLCVWRAFMAEHSPDIQNLERLVQDFAFIDKREPRVFHICWYEIFFSATGEKSGASSEHLTGDLPEDSQRYFGLAAEAEDSRAERSPI